MKIKEKPVDLDAAEQPFAGGDWVRESLGVVPSQFGMKVGNILGRVFYGIYHLDTDRLSRVDWLNRDHIQLLLGASLATWDNCALTDLVLLCHDGCVRLEIKPRSPRDVLLIFHRRTGRDGRTWDRHPTIEDAIARVRGQEAS